MVPEASPSYRYIVRSPDLRGGRARVEGTRIAGHDVLVAQQMATAPEAR